MKINIMIAVSLLSALNALSQTFKLPTKDSLVFYENIIRLKDTTVTQDKLFTTGETWFANTFVNSKEVLKVDDRQGGKLIGKGNSIFDLFTNLYYTIEIYAKNGKYRYRVYDLGFLHDNGYKEDISLTYKNYLNGKADQVAFQSKKRALARIEKDFIHVNEIINMLLDNLKTAMNKADTDDFK